MKNRSELWSYKEHDQEQLMRDIQMAHRKWREAQTYFDFALNKEEIDYSIYLLKAMETRLSMLLNYAKNERVTRTEYDFMNWSR